MSARFRIKIAQWPTRSPIILADTLRPAFRGHYRTIEAACRAMDNIIRRERGMPERIGFTPAEVQAEMSKRRANLLDGKVPHAAPVRHVNAPCTVEPILTPADSTATRIERVTR